jgi:hypothetical protein
VHLDEGCLFSVKYNDENCQYMGLTIQIFELPVDGALSEGQDHVHSGDCSRWRVPHGFKMSGLSPMREGEVL